jgi:hypothetical protein
VLGRTINGYSAGDLTRDDVLDDFTLYWLTNTAISAARFYWELHLNLYNAANVSIPAAVSVFPGENYQAPRSWTEQAYDKLIYYNKVDKGGHYAAWEQPQLFSEELRAGFRSLRSHAAKPAAQRIVTSSSSVRVGAAVPPKSGCLRYWKACGRVSQLRCMSLKNLAALIDQFLTAAVRPSLPLAG